MIEAAPAGSGVLPRAEVTSERRSEEAQVEFAAYLGVLPAAMRDPSAAGPTTDDRGVRLAEAQRFNEDGWFGTPVAADGAEPSHREAEPPAALPPRADDGLPPQSCETDHSSRLPAAAETASERTTPARAAQANAFLPARTSLASSGLTPAASTAERHAAMPADGGEEVAPSPASKRMLAQAAARGAQSATRVALSETEQGVRVAVATDALPAEERQRLRDEIAALLARHGLWTDGIRIVARPAPHASYRGNK